MKRALGFVVALVLTLFVTRAARAQSFELNATVDSETVEVGETLTYTQRAISHGAGSPSDAKPGPLPGFSLLGASSAPIQMRSIVNGAVSDVSGLITSWTLRADRAGTFSLGPSQITVNGARRTGPAVRVKVVERGAAPPRPRGPRPSVDPFGSSTLDPFKGLFDFGDDDRRPDPFVPSADPKLAMDSPRAPVAFLHATLDKARAVVGEQVTLAVYLYEDPYARQGRPGDVHEATASDFVKRSLLEDETRAVGAGTAMVGGKLWNVKLVRKNALFPLKTGHLTIEPMSMTLPQARVGLRASEALAVDVTEPPLAGRPPGYAVGDVGEMSLQATVTPRATAREGAIGVTVELRGTGNLPSQLTMPSTPGVEWLEPQIRDKLGAMQNDRFGGARTFSYVARLHKEGAVDLGEVRLPHYDASKGAYSVARATLGIVNVAPGGAGDAGVEEAEVLLAGMPKARQSLEGRPAQSYLSEQRSYWLFIIGSPLACIAGIGAQRLLGKVRERRERAAPSAEQTAKERRSEAEAAVRDDEGKVAMGAIARAIEAGVLAKSGANLRGAGGDTARTELEEAGVSAEDARSIIALLRDCEDARFSPDGVAIESARETWARARSLLDGLTPTASRSA